MPNENMQPVKEAPIDHTVRDKKRKPELPPELVK